MPPRERETETFRDAQLIFRNFKGEKGQYNAEGDRNFSVVFGEPEAQVLLSKGWNLKPLRRHDEADEQMYHLKVKVSFDNYPPRIWLITNGGQSRSMLSSELVGMLDDLQSTRVDMVIAAYNWEMRGQTGKTAYLQSLFFNMFEDELELEYASIPEAPVTGLASAAVAEDNTDPLY